MKKKLIIYSSLCAASVLLVWATYSHFIPRKIDPISFERSYNEASQLLLDGKNEEAITIFKTLISFDDTYPTIFFNLGRAYANQKEWEQALEYYKKAASLNPNFGPILNFNMALAYDFLGDREQAKKSLVKSIEENPDYHEAHYFLGTLYEKDKEYNKAYEAYSKAIQYDNKYVRPLQALATILRDLHDFEQAISCMDRVIEKDGTNFYNYLMLGDCHNMIGHHELAEELYKKSAELNPQSHESWNNLGALYGAVKGDYKTARKYLAKALEIKPDHPGTHCAFASAYLAEGDYENGWKEYECRLNYYFEKNQRKYSKPRWDGKQSLQGRKILLTAEQGFGDTFHFIRYAAELKKKGAYVIAHVQSQLMKLLRHCPYLDKFIVDDQIIDDYDYHAELMSLPYLCKTSLTTIPSDMPYLYPNEELRESWQQRLSKDKNFKIGICWQVEKTHDADTYRSPHKTISVEFSKRSIPLEEFAQLAQLEGVSVYSLQKGFSDFHKHMPPGITIKNFGADFDKAYGPFMDTAAIMKSLDLVVTADTSVAHLAGGLGVPVWIMVPFPAEWRWLLNRSDSPWYPTMKIFRNKPDQDWHSLMQEVVACVDKQIKKKLVEVK